MARRDTAFDPTDLAACIVRGAAENDLVRLHGSIDAALQLHAPIAAADIFAPALKDGGRLYGAACAGAIATAIRLHLNARKPTTGARTSPPQPETTQRPQRRGDKRRRSSDRPK